MSETTEAAREMREVYEEPREMTNATGGPTVRPIASCACHPGSEAVTCPACGSDRAYRWRSRPGIDRTWHRDTPGWRCSDCGASGQPFALVAA